jgi:hypothetical protein
VSPPPRLPRRAPGAGLVQRACISTARPVIFDLEGTSRDLLEQLENLVPVQAAPWRAAWSFSRSSLSVTEAAADAR